MDETSTGSRTVQRSINILNCFTLEESELTLTEISTKTGLAKSTTSRLLETLVFNGLLRKKHSSSKYQLGYKMYKFGRIAESTISFEIIDIARSYMEKLRDKVGETVSLYMLENNKRKCIARVGSNQSISHVVRVGETLALEIGSGGKVLLAFQTQTYIDSFLKRLDVEDIRKRLITELPMIRQEYSATSLNERGAGVNSVASPILEIGQEVNFCLSISGPSSRFTKEAIDLIKDELKEIATTISERFSEQKEIYE